ncbi:putative serine/threonine-protein kinase [Capsicum annuum]|uniref:serine/threonine-protein kinase n=1 Tax=Capsicum annuum TaxID=4072 RepID=UPI00123298FA|nr:serine/threonine-protein kinase [Capsicum annuum]KAF3612560.1 putative serine/threonine-protein kinase [Capsicum annuum]KAF3628164.1 putative serine/threonine-protein kinase [Capsicum annuum]
MSTFLNNELSKRTSIFGLRLWVVLGICVGVAIVLVLFLISLWFTSKRNSRKTVSRKTLSISAKKKPQNPNIPKVSKEIQEIRIDPFKTPPENPKLLPAPAPVPLPAPEPDSFEEKTQNSGDEQRIHIEIGKGHKIEYPVRVGSGSGSGHGSGEVRSNELAIVVVPEVSHLGWGHWYTLRELEIATNYFAEENVIGEGGYGIVYRGVMVDNSRVAVKNLLNNRGQAEKEFKVEVEAIGRVRHKNLVRLLGYCAEGAHRMLVYEYVDHGNLEQWLHGDVGPSSPLTWEIRMDIILGTAKGLTYLHEGLEPKVVHRDIKSSNILLDKQWNPKVSDFGLAKLLGAEKSYITTRVMGTFGYVAPEYASTGMLNERSDVYSFGILIMEIITGRNPVDYSRPPGEVTLVDWLKVMVSNRNAEGVLDPKLPVKPSSRALKRVLLVALRCVDPNAQKRPKMGHVIHMLEADDFPFRDERRGSREHGRSYRDGVKERVMDKRVIESGDSSGYESSVQTNWSLVRKQETDDEH